MNTYTSEGDDNSATRFSDEIVEKPIERFLLSKKFVGIFTEI
jgi:hypothetical protein